MTLTSSRRPVSQDGGVGPEDGCAITQSAVIHKTVGKRLHNFLKPLPAVLTIARYVTSGY